MMILRNDKMLTVKTFCYVVVISTLLYCPNIHSDKPHNSPIEELVATTDNNEVSISSRLLDGDTITNTGSPNNDELITHSTKYPRNVQSPTRVTANDPHSRKSKSILPPKGYGTVGHRVPYGTFEFWCFVSISIATVLFAGFASGMTMGLLSLDPIQLKVACLNGTDKERKRATAVTKLIDNHHLLLVTLLLANSLATEALPIFLDRLIPSWMAVLLSVTCILFFGEVIPQAICTGRKQLAITSAMSPAVKLLMVCFFFAAYPISKLLDWLLGDNDAPTFYSRLHLKTLIRMHQKPDRRNSGIGNDESSALGHDEVVVIEGALDLANKTLKEIMIPIENVYMLEWNTVFTKDVMLNILQHGHSRIPIYRGTRDNIRGLVMVKSLILADHNEGIRAHKLLQKKIPLFEDANQAVYNMLNEFQKGSSHICFVTYNSDEYRHCLKIGIDVPDHVRIMGVVTLEDVIEELIQEEIYDEYDTDLPSPHFISDNGYSSMGKQTAMPIRGLVNSGIFRNTDKLTKSLIPIYAPPNSCNESDSQIRLSVGVPSRSNSKDFYNPCTNNSMIAGGVLQQQHSDLTVPSHRVFGSLMNDCESDILITLDHNITPPYSATECNTGIEYKSHCPASSVDLPEVCTDEFDVKPQLRSSTSLIEKTDKSEILSLTNYKFLRSSTNPFKYATTVPNDNVINDKLEKQEIDSILLGRSSSIDISNTVNHRQHTASTTISYSDELPILRASTESFSNIGTVDTSPLLANTSQPIWLNSVVRRIATSHNSPKAISHSRVSNLSDKDTDVYVRMSDNNYNDDS